MEVFGGESVGVILGKAMAKASLTIEILSYLLLAPRVIPTKNKIPTILEILHERISEGVTVSILLNDKFPTGWLKRREEEERQRLRTIGAIVKTYPRKTILHSKMLLIDRSIAYIGSVNLTTESMTRNHEILIKITEPQAIERLSKIFYTAWKKVDN